MYPTPGSKWRHFRTGGIYTVLNIGTDTETGETVVIYQGLDGRIWVRPYQKKDAFDERSCWNDEIDEVGTKRFIKL